MSAHDPVAQRIERVPAEDEARRSNRLGVATLLVPVASGVLSVVFLGKGFDAVKAIGAVVILAGLNRPATTAPDYAEEPDRV